MRVGKSRRMCRTDPEATKKTYGFPVQTKCHRLASPCSSLITPLLLLTTMKLRNNAKDKIKGEVQKVGRGRQSGLGSGDGRSKDRHLTAIHPKEGGPAPAFSDSQSSNRRDPGWLISPLEQTECSPAKSGWLVQRTRGCIRSLTE